MSTPSKNELLQNYVTVYDSIPGEWNEAREFLVDQLRQISDAINARDIGYYVNDEQLSGQQFVSGTDKQQFRDVFRKVIVIGALPNAATKSVAHGITTNGNTFITRIYGTATKPEVVIPPALPTLMVSAIPLPYIDLPVVLGNVSLSIDQTNIIITTTGNYSEYTRTYVVVEYVQEG